MAVPPVLLFTVFLYHWYVIEAPLLWVAVMLMSANSGDAGLPEVSYTALLGVVIAVMPLMVIGMLILVTSSSESSVPLPFISAKSTTFVEPGATASIASLLLTGS